MLEITLKYIDGRWFWNVNGGRFEDRACQTSSEAVAAAIADAIATQEAEAAYALSRSKDASANAAALRQLR